MGPGFGGIPDVVIDYVRDVFAGANEKVSRALTDHPSMHEPMLDGILIAELSASPPAFFAAEQIALNIETHWLGGRWMYRRWEIADIALIVMLRRRGHLEQRKVALLQTKRLYSKELPAEADEPEDYVIGIGRLADRTDPQRPFYQQRAFGFDQGSTYDATRAGHEQVNRIEAYFGERDIPVYYGLYNPLVLPFKGLYPAAPDTNSHLANEFGCRVLRSSDVHGPLARLSDGQAPSVANLTLAMPLDASDPGSTRGWRLERFVADEVLRCQEGKLFDDQADPNLRALFYARTAPITAAIVMTVDMDGDRRD
ncbi:hypothetical protein QE385_003945 [Sphingomonas sp. SORGH_AS 950]|uniref:hypothetical protein n=1 Tax=Sphingomonas sp. SORGH_AS_0950 TaxID=3041792 RepID=UPI00278A85E0|nr:hypothetical protein [Sphingomonas sp. SORGH_AS_0950]MDQ1159548.1 hypothetical protein [Sphingomonas sp. SORGH_AS_0950]